MKIIVYGSGCLYPYSFLSKQNKAKKHKKKKKKNDSDSEDCLNGSYTDPINYQKKYSGAHSRVATLMQPSFQKRIVLYVQKKRENTVRGFLVCCTLKKRPLFLLLILVW